MKTSILVVLLFLTCGTLSAAGSTAAGPSAAVGQAGEPLQVTADIQKPAKISGDPPIYTEAARKERLQGTVVLKAIISEGGDVTDVEVLKGLPMGLSEAAAKAVESWKFKPALKDGLPIRVYYTLTVNFEAESLDDPQVLLWKLARLCADESNPEAQDAPRIAAVREDVTTGRSTFAATAAWAKGYKGESRSKLLTWVGAEAWRRVRERPATGEDAERASLLEIGIAAEEAAIAGEGGNAVTCGVVEANVYLYLLSKRSAELSADPAAKANLESVGFRSIGEAQKRYNALASAAARNEREREKPVEP